MKFVFGAQRALNFRYNPAPGSVVSLTASEPRPNPFAEVRMLLGCCPLSNGTPVATITTMDPTPAPTLDQSAA